MDWKCNIIKVSNPVEDNGESDIEQNKLGSLKSHVWGTFVESLVMEGEW